MKLLHLKDTIRGWMVGKFADPMFEKDYELGFKYYQAGDYEKSHAHFMSDEVTIILLGEVEMNGVKYSEGDIVVQEKGEYTDFKVLSERVITGIYRPDGSFPNDKTFKE